MPSGALFQSTHPSGVRHGSGRNHPRTPVISIHAPQWGATGSPDAYPDQSDHISIHAPQWGATSRPRRNAGWSGFQSTHPSGVRPIPAFYWNAKSNISIHAPQWGATILFRSAPASRRHISIHAPQWGATIPHVAHRLQHVISIHAPQWDATSRNSIIPTMHQHFNPRTPVGCDRIGWSATYQGVVTFQSTHPSGVRHDRYTVRRVEIGISIHAPQWGATASMID